MNKRYIKYVPHGVNDKVFYPIYNDSPEYNNLVDFKNQLFDGKEYDFVLFFNSRNIRRKQIQDTLMAYLKFVNSLTEEQAQKCCFLLHTQAVDPNGTDIPRFINDIILPQVNTKFNYVIHEKIVTQKVMNLLYNSSDCQILLSSNEGWGLSLTEAMMCGNPIIANVTGGMQDQLGFFNLEFDKVFTSNNIGRYKETFFGCYAVFPSNISIQGSPQTPYISDDRCTAEDAAKQILNVYINKTELSLEVYNRVRKAIRERVTSSKQDYRSSTMGKSIIEAVDHLLENWTPREKYNIFKV